jgi:integrase
MNKPGVLPKETGTSGIRIRKDRLGRFHYLANQNASHGAARIREIQIAVLKGALDQEPQLVRLIGSLMLFDGILLPKDLDAAVLALPGIYRWRSHVVLEWLRSDGRQDRRFLSSPTQSLLSEISDSYSQMKPAAAVHQLVECCYPEEGKELSHLLSDLQAYFQEVLPGPLFSHVAGTVPITALPRSDLARETTELALVSHRTDAISAGMEALGNALDHVLQGKRTSSSAWLVDQAVNVCLQHSRKNDAQDKATMLRACHELSTKASLADQRSALILAWIVDLIESGSVLERNPKPQTIYKYVSRLAPQLRILLEDINLEKLDAQELHEVYESILAATTPGNKTNTLSAIKSWHLFLVETLGVPPLFKKLDEQESLPIPSAHVIWPHELDSIQAWITQSTLDERLRTQLSLCFYLASNLRLRAKELFYLRLWNVIDYGTTIELQIAPRRINGTPKTKQGRRAQVLTCQKTIEILRAWLERRRMELALPNDLLMGCPQEPRTVYRLGQMYVLINRLLKDVTGGRQVSLHTLSHTWATTHLTNALLVPATTDINQLEVIAKDAGHLSASTTFFHYFHNAEEPLQKYLSDEFRHLTITSNDAERWSGVKADTLRQRASSQDRDNQVVYWESIFSRQVWITKVTAATEFDLTDPTMPGYLHKVSRLGFDAVLHGLEELSLGMSLETVASRMGTDVQRVMIMREMALRRVARLRVKGSNRRSGISSKDGASMGALHDQEIDFSRFRQDKWRTSRAWLTKHINDEELPVLIQAWERSFDRGYWAITEKADAITLFRFLHEAGVPTMNLALATSYELTDQPSPKELWVERALDLAFESRFGIPPMHDVKPTRRSRPKHYLIWSGKSLVSDSNATSASISLAGFHAMLLAAAVHREMTSRDAMEARRSEA